MHHLHIFLSSPGDVSRERQLAREVIDQIQSERLYRDQFKLEIVAWDNPGQAPACRHTWNHRRRSTVGSRNRPSVTLSLWYFGREWERYYLKTTAK
jgi:hypothetical protein